MSRPPLPPFTTETAALKARLAEDAWNSRDPVRVAQAYTEDSRWRNRSEFFHGRAAIERLVTDVHARTGCPPLSDARLAELMAGDESDGQGQTDRKSVV